MKNKKLFAILTLVCFMFTLMPVAAFAAGTLTVTQEDGNLYITSTDKNASAVYVKNPDSTVWQTSSMTFDNGVLSIGAYSVEQTVVGRLYADNANGENAVAITADHVNAAKTATAWAAWKNTQDTTNWNNLVDAYEASSGAGIDTDAAEAAKVVNYDTAAQAIAYWQGNASSSLNYVKSTFATADSNLELDVNEFGKAIITLKASNGAGDNGFVYVWAEEVTDKASGALMVDTYKEKSDNIYEIDMSTVSVKELSIGFTTSGTYKLHAAYRATEVTDFTVNALGDLDGLKGEITIPADYNTVVVVGEDADSSKFTMDVAVTDIDKTTVSTTGVTDDGKAVGLIGLAANGVDTDKVVLTFKDGNEPVVGYGVTVETNSSAIEVSKNTLTTNYAGQVEFYVSGTVEGTYLIDVVCEDFNAEIEVTVGNTAAAYIASEKQPATPQALYGVLGNDKVTFVITDINGNVVDDYYGMSGIANNAKTGKYIVLTEVPAKSDLKSKDLSLVYLNDGTWGLKGIDKDAEGTYAVKVILDNGAVATATWEVKKFQTPVALIFDEAPSTVELGAQFTPYLIYLDANNVAKVANDAELAVTGYAVADLTGNTVTVKTDEKYAGSTITITGVSEKYDLVATKDITVAAEAVAIEFEDKALEVNVNNKVEWNVVDAEGNEVSLANKYAAGITASVKYVVLDKPENAKVSVTGTNNIANFKGEGEMRLTSNMVGNVTVQVVAKVEFGSGFDSTVAKQTKYYTGTQIFAVGTAGVGDVVVMSIGSNEIVINDAKATIDAAPIVENNRTFVPFRALAEAFGADVAYDEATQAVTAELNGVTVVMTIGSAEYTVNGEAKTADVAPFINGSRTMVPVRFAAEAFGIKVIPTYDENGATADILFNL